MEAASPSLESASAGRGFGVGRIVIVLVTLAVLAAAGYVVYVRYFARPVVIPVSGTPITVRRGNVAATINATGSVISTKQSRLAPQIGGRLKELPVKLGDEVKAGAMLARIETATLEMKVAQARSTLRTSQIRLDQLRAGTRPEEIASTEASLLSAQAKLADIQAGTLPQDITQSQFAVESAAASVRSAQARYDQLKNGASAADISSAEQSAVSAQIALQKAEIDLARVQTGPLPEDIRAAEIALDQAKNNLWAQQLSRDATCGRGAGGACDAGQATVASAESGVVAAKLKVDTLKNKQPDSKDVQAAQGLIDNARESLRSAQIRLKQVRDGSTAEELAQSRAAIDGAQANYQSAISRLSALNQGAKAVDVQSAQSAIISAQTALALKKAPNTPQDIALLQEQVSLSEISLQQAQLDLENATLVAPYDGVIGAITVNVGEQVGTGAAILVLVDKKSTRIDISVDETDITRISVGKAASISFDSIPDRPLAGKVLGVAPTSTVQQGVATYTVSIALDDPSIILQPGMTANVNIVVADRQNVLVIPNRALKRQGRNQTVELLVNGKTESRTIKAGLSNDQMTEVLEGLAEGDSVLIPATTTIQPRVSGFGGAAVAAKPVAVTK